MAPSYILTLSEAQNHRCYYCQLPMQTEPTKAGTIPSNQLTKDHYIPRCYGGPTNLENLVAACGQCNWIRGSLDAETFHLLVQQWFRSNTRLRARWHSISRAEFKAFKQECERVDRIKWTRRIKRCVGAMALNALVPIPLPPHQIRA